MIFGFISSGIDNAAHLGGILSGFIISLILIPKTNNEIFKYGSFDRVLIPSKIIHKLITSIYTKISLSLLMGIIFIIMITYRVNSGY